MTVAGIVHVTLNKLANRIPLIDKALRVQDNRVSSEGPRLPAHDTSVPAHASSLPATNRVLPAADRVLPATDRGLPATDRGLPATDRSLPATDFFTAFRENPKKYNQIGFSTGAVRVSSLLALCALLVAICVLPLALASPHFADVRKSPLSFGAYSKVFASLAGTSVPFVANTTNTYTGSTAGNITTTTNWSLSHVPTVSEDAVFSGSVAGGIRNYGTGTTVGAPVTVGSFDVTATSGTYSIRNSANSSTNAILTLGGAGNLGNGVSGTASDLLYVASGATFALRGDNGGGNTGSLNVVLGQSGNFNAAGTMSSTAVISDGGNAFGITKTGAGTLTLSAGNTYTGATTINAGTLALSGSGSIANSPTIEIAGGAAFDVTGLTSGMTLTSGQALKATGAGTTGLITLSATGTLTTASNSPLQFTAYNGTTNPLGLAGSGNLTLQSGNPVTVTTTTPLAVGNYTLIQKSGSTAVAGTAPTSVTVNGSGLSFGTTAALSIATGNLVLNVTSLPASSVKYRSAASGNWSATNTWEVSTDGTNWVAATSTPTSANDTITVRDTHTVTVTANVNADQLTVSPGGILAINGGVTLTIDNGADLVDLGINRTSPSNYGTVNIADTGVLAGAGSVSVAGELGIASSNATDGLATNVTAPFSLSTNSTVNFNGTTQTVGARDYYNLNVSGDHGGGTVTFGSGAVGIFTSFNPTATNVTYAFNSSNTFEYKLPTTGISTTVLPPAFTHYNSLKSNELGNTIGPTGLVVDGTLEVAQGTFTSASDYNHVTIDSGATLSLSSAITVSGNWTNDGTFTANTFTVTFDGTGAQTITTGGTGPGKPFAGVAINKTSGTATLAGDLSDTSLNITQGTLDQGASFSIFSGAVTVGASGIWTNTGTGDLQLSSTVTNNGSITFNGNGIGCPQNDDIAITSSVNGTQRAWSGAGTFSMTDVSVRDQGGTATIVVQSGTNVSGNGLNWIFLSTCSAYTWTGTVNTDWTNGLNWSPTRGSAAPTDILIFGSNTPAPTVTNVAGVTGGNTETIAELHINNSSPSFSTGGANNTLLINAGAGITGLEVIGSAPWAITGSNSLIIKLGTGTQGKFAGTMTMAGGNHALVSNDAGGIMFTNGSIFTTTTGYTGNPFGDGVPGFGAADSVRFLNGSTYNHNAGLSPFGTAGNASVVTFQTGSTARWFTSSGFQASGRTYANLEVGSNTGAVSVSDTGTGNFQFDNLTMNSPGGSNSSLVFTGSGGSTITIQGDLTSNGGTGSLQDVTLQPGTNIVVSKPGNGTINFVDNSGNSRGVMFQGNASVASGTTLVLGRIVQMGNPNPHTRTLTVAGALTGNASGYVVGSLKKTFAAAGTLLFEVGSEGYSPVTVNATSGTFPADFTAAARVPKHPGISGSNALTRYWSLSAGSITANLTFQYLLTDVVGTETNYKVFKYDGSFTQVPNQTVDDGAHTATVTGVTSFSDWTLAEPSSVTNPPTISNDGVQVTVDEGGDATKSGTFDDADGRNTVTITAKIGGTPVGTIDKDDTNGTWSWSYTTTDGPENSGTVVITAADGTSTATTQFDLVVNNVAPTITLSGTDNVKQPCTYTLNLDDITDPGTDTVSSYTIDWGDGSPQFNDTGSPANTSQTHLYAAAGPYTITVSLTDEDGAHPTAGSKSITVYAELTTYVVNDAGDEGDFDTDNPVCETSPGTGTCTLRAAIEQANSNCSSTPVTIDATNVGDFVIDVWDQMLIDHDITINGPGADDLELDAQDDSWRIFEVAVNRVVTINGLTMERGDASEDFGGGIKNSGNLTLANCALFDNQAGRGGGIDNCGTLTIKDSVLAGNVAYSDNGGAIRNKGALTMVNTLLLGNAAMENGGGLHNDAETATAKLVNCTFWLNTADAGYTDEASGGGIFNNNGNVRLVNTIVAQNDVQFLAADGPSDIAGSNVDTDNSSHNLIGLGGSGGLINSNGNQVGVADPKLGITGVPRPGSPAIDTGDDCVLATCTPPLGFSVTTDQRGIDRPQGAHVDIGAFEVKQAIVNVADDHDDTACEPRSDGHDCTLREAINVANDNPGTLIVFDIKANEAGHYYYKDDGLPGVSLVEPTTVDDNSISDFDPDWPHSWWSIKVHDTGLPIINENTYIDGYSQPGSKTNDSETVDNAIIRIELSGAELTAPADGLTIEAEGGDCTVTGLVINQFAYNGISLYGGSYNTINGSFIGTDVSGTLALGNGGTGVTVNESDTNLIGCTVPGERNIISGNRAQGVELENTVYNFVQGNFIGVAADGHTPLGNGAAGVEVCDNAYANTIGVEPPVEEDENRTRKAKTSEIAAAESRPNHSTAAGKQVTSLSAAIAAAAEKFACHAPAATTAARLARASRAGKPQADSRAAGFTPALVTSSPGANIIASNLGDGVLVSGSDDVFNLISQNSIHSNGALGINLLGGTGEDGYGVTPNDENVNDVDDGPNTLQNFPEITDVTASGGTGVVKFNLDTCYDGPYTIEFFANSGCDASGHGEGLKYLGSKIVPGSGTDYTVTLAINDGDSITATATDGFGNTSEFSACFCAKPATPTATNDGPACENGSVSLHTPDAGPNATYAWTGPNGFTANVREPVVTNLSSASAGTYSVTVTIGSCPSDPGTTELAVKPAPSTPTASNTGPYIEGQTIQLNTDTVSGATYSWTGPNGFTSSDQNPTISPATTANAGNYTIFVTVDGCASATRTTNVEVNACQNFTVNSESDTHDANQGDGVCQDDDKRCTLRAAIEEANMLPTCGTINIDFQNPVNSITLDNAATFGQLTIDHNVNIDGSTAQSLVISGNNATRIFTVNNGRTASISTMTLTKGNGSGGDGGAIRNNGTLTLNRVTLGEPTIPNPAVNGNSAVNGGAIRNDGNLVLINTTISGNKANADGAGLYNANGQATLTNVTIAYNRADNDNAGGGNGGGLTVAGGTVLLHNTIVADNYQGGDPSMAANDISGTVDTLSSSYNLIGTGAGGLTNGGANHNQVGVATALLGKLINNGGQTFTLGLLYNSPAIDAGDPAVVNSPLFINKDQRGLDRPSDGDNTGTIGVDIGAYERQLKEERFAEAGANVTIDMNDVRLTFPSVESVQEQIVELTANAVPPAVPAGSDPVFDIHPRSHFYSPPVTMCFYLPAITNPTTFGELRVYHREDGVLVEHAATKDFANKTVCINDITSFSQFAIVRPVVNPTATNAEVSGQILDNHGNPVEGAAVRLAGTQSRLAITDAQGNYHFDAVETNGFYVVTPSRTNFSFSPTQRSFSQLGAHTDAVFTGTPAGSAVNPLEASEYFVRQQYLDFLGREPDESGFNFWVNNIESCGNDAVCREVKRIDTSAAFFFSIEFQQTGYLVYRAYEAAYGDLDGTPVPLTLREFTPDTQKISNGVVVLKSGWQQKLDTNKQAFMNEFVERPRFTSAYPTSMTPAQFVDKLFATAHVESTDPDYAAAIAMFGGAIDTSDAAARARVLRRLAENSTFTRKQFNRAFVLMEYFGYLRRDPNSGRDTDFSGYHFWLDKLDTFNGSFQNAEMVKAFLSSTEFRGRFPR